jgi:hypothetical protein
MLSQQKINAVGAAAFDAEHGQRQAGTHISDIAVGAGKPRQRRLADRQAPDQPTRHHGENEGAHGAKRGRNQERRIIELLERGLRHDPEQQSGQRNVQQKELHPGEARFRKPFGLAAGEANEDQSEIRQSEIENVDHR